MATVTGSKRHLDITSDTLTTSSNVDVGAKLFITTTDSNTSSTTALVLNSTEVEARTLGSNAFNSTAFLTSETFSSSDVALSLGGNDIIAGTSITLAGGLSYNDSTSTLSQTDNNTTYSAGTGLTLTNTTFSVTANTYAAASHNHDDRYYTETQSDARYPRGVTKSYTSVDTDSDVDAWYKIFQTTDSGSSPVECHVRGYAHSSISFIVSEGYLGSGGHVQVLDYCLSTNNNYKWIKGVRIISNGDVELLLQGGSTVSLEMTVIGDAVVVNQPELSSAASNTVKDTVVNPTTGMLRAKGVISGSNTSNWDTAYTHSQAAHAPSNAEQNVQSDWNETGTTSDAYIKNKPTLGTAAASAATDFVSVTGDSMSGVLSLNYNGVGLEVGNTANSGADTGIRIRGARNGQDYSTNNLTSYILLSNFDDNTTPNNYDLVKIGGGMYDANSDTGYLRIETNNGTALTKALDIDKNQDAKFYGDVDADGNITASNLNVSNWDTAYGWGDHASAGYSTATNVENNADVTDSTNVAAAGALMASGNTLTGTMKVTGSIIYENDTDSGYIPFPKGAQYQTKTNSHTGAIKITLPTHGGDDMVKWVVDIYDYSTGESVTMFMGGYIYQATGGNEWVSCTVTTLTEHSSKDYTVRFGADGTNSCVWIGETNSTWAYPQVIVRDFYAGFISDIDAYDDNWSISFVTSFDTVDEVISDNLPTADWDRIEGKPGNATTSANGLMSSTDKTKLDSVASNADVTPSWVPANDPSYLTALPTHSHNNLYYTEDEIRLALARTNGWEAGYGSGTASNIKWNLTEEALELRHDSDSSIGAVYKAVWMEAGETKRWTVMIRGSQVTSNGMYIRLYQHDGNLPDGKTHVSNDAQGTFVQEDDRGDTGWYENGAISDSWTVFEREYKAPSAGYVSLVVLNWTGNGTESLFIKNPDIQTVYAKVESGSIGITELAVSDGTNGQVLTTNGSGTLSFATVSSGGSDTNYYLDGITRTDSTNTLVFSVNGATNQSYTFGANAFNSTTIPAAEQYTAHEDTSTLNGTYGSTANGTKIDEITVDANGHITAITTGATGNMTGFFVEDGDGTEVQINNANEWKFVEGTGIDINWTDTSAGSDTDPYDLTIACTIDSPGEVGLANLSSSGNALAGTFTATGDLIAYSDARVKENVETIPNALEKVTALRGVNFNKIGEEKRSTGVIAQEVAEVIPEVVHESEDGMLGVAYGNITGLLIEAIKEQQKQIDELKAKLDGSTK